MTRIQLLGAAVIYSSRLSSDPFALKPDACQRPFDQRCGLFRAADATDCRREWPRRCDGAVPLRTRLDAYYAWPDAGAFMTDQEKLQGLMDRAEICEVLYN